MKNWAGEREGIAQKIREGPVFHFQGKKRNEIKEEVRSQSSWVLENRARELRRKEFQRGNPSVDRKYCS